MKTPLYEEHRALGAKFVDFCGWEMPLQYQGILQEHLAVRTKAGLFDVSHMGRIFVEGPEAGALLEALSPNHVLKGNGAATYTVWCRESGMCVDDLIVYQVTPLKFFLIVNACNREKDLSHLRHYAIGRDVQIADRYREDGILALQGPAALEFISKLFPESARLKPMHFLSVPHPKGEIAISRTGYTGEKGVEIYAPHEALRDLWRQLLDAGAVSAGLGARDTLRLEMGYALYGHEISESIAPSETVCAWTIHWNKPDFVGKAALESLSSHARSEYGIILKDKGIAREGYPVFAEGQKIGVVTSGTMSPSLNLAIAIVLVERKLTEGDSVEVQIRQNRCRAEVVDLPFYKPEKAK